MEAPTMTTADEAWKAMLHYRDGYNPFSKDVVGEAFLAGFAAGVTAGATQALEDAADAIRRAETQELYGWDMAIERAAEIVTDIGSLITANTGAETP